MDNFKVEAQPSWWLMKYHAEQPQWGKNSGDWSIDYGYVYGERIIQEPESSPHNFLH